MSWRSGAWFGYRKTFPPIKGKPWIPLDATSNSISSPSSLEPQDRRRPPDSTSSQHQALSADFESTYSSITLFYHLYTHTIVKMSSDLW